MNLAGGARTLPARSGALPRVDARGAATVLLIAGICAIPVILYLPFLTEPFFRDEGLYAAVAQIILHGGIPYEDAFDNKPPMIYLWYTASFLLFGENVWAPRLLVALLLSGSTLLMYLEGRMLFSHRGGVVAATAFALSFGLATLETSANTEFFMIPPMVGALFSFTMGQRSGNAGWYGACGFLSGIAMATKHISLFAFALYILLAAWPLLRAQGVRSLAAPEFRRSVGGLVAGCLAAFLVVAGPFIAMGAGPEMFEQTVVYTQKYVGGGSLETKLSIMRKLPMYLTLITGPWLLFSVLAIARIVRSKADGHGPLLLGWLVANWLGIMAAGRFYDHYFVTLLPAMSLMAPLGAKLLRDNWRRPAAMIVLMGLLPLLLVAPVIGNAKIYFQPTPEERHIEKYATDDRAPWENQGPEFGAWLQARTQPDDGVYNFGFQSELYFYADRRSPTRFIMDRPFWYSDGYVGQALEELNADPPIYVIDSAIYEDWSEQKLYTTRIKDWIVANYDYVGKVFYADVWKLKEQTE